MLLFLIAEAIGGYTVEELAESISVEEFEEWAAFFHLRREEEEKAMREVRRGR